MKVQAKPLRIKAFIRPLKKEGHGVHCVNIMLFMYYTTRDVKSI